MITTKRQKFFEVALQLIHEKGYKATTMRDIAAKMDFEVANVYNYISSKHALLETYLFEISQDLHNEIEHIISSSYSPRDKLRAVISQLVRLASKKPYKFGLVINEWRNLKEPKLSEFVTRRQDYENKVRQIISDGMKSKQFNQYELEIATHTILSSVRWLNDWYTQNEDSNPVEIEKQIVDLLFRGIEKHKPVIPLSE